MTAPVRSPFAKTGSRFVLAAALLTLAAFAVGLQLLLRRVFPQPMALCFVTGLAGLLVGAWGRRKLPVAGFAALAGLLFLVKPFAVPLDCTRSYRTGFCALGDDPPLAFFVAAGLAFLLAGLVVLVPFVRRQWAARASKSSDASERIIEMTWRCTSCGKANLGRHLVCQGCKRAMDGTEKYEMPADTSKAATVTESSLLRMAEAGPNWRCAYCDSDQRALDGRCRSCGADAPRSLPSAEQTSAWSPRAVSYAGAICLLAWAGGIVVGSLNADPLSFREAAVRLQEVRWTRTVTVLRRQALAGEGFEEKRPAEAFDVKPAGTREHHQETVCDRMGEESYTEEVPDGYREERYTEEVSCGETCTRSSESCSEKCTSKKNGFASCRTVCSGGGEHCTTKYCKESRTRQVPKTRTEHRTRSVCRESHQEPRFAGWFNWKTWDWRFNRAVSKEGSRDQERVWPADDEVKLQPPEEQTTKAERLLVTLVESSGARHSLDPDEPTWTRLSAQKTYRMRVRTDVIGEDKPELLEPPP